MTVVVCVTMWICWWGLCFRVGHEGRRWGLGQGVDVGGGRGGYVVESGGYAASVGRVIMWLRGDCDVMGDLGV